MTGTTWHYMQSGKSVGPFSQEQLIAMIVSGTLSANVMVWAQGVDKWKPAKEVFDLSSEMPPPLPINKMAAMRAAIFKGGACTWSASPPHPWRRYFARMLDIAVNGIIVLSAFGIVMGVLAPQFAANFFRTFSKPGSGPLLDAMVTTFSATFLTAAIIGFTGTSLGKWFFGIRVTDGHDRPMGYKLAWKREMMVWAKGLGLGIPIIALATIITAYQRLNKEGQTSWDDELGLRVIYCENNAVQIVKSIVGFVALITIVSILRAM